MATHALPIQADLTIVQGETKTVLHIATSTWVIASAEFEARSSAEDDPVISLSASSGITIAEGEEAGSIVEVTIDDTVSTELNAGTYVYELRVVIDGEPVSFYMGSMTVRRTVIE